ncbi:unnamed protein product [Phytomonas sp. EM1]|nr:unnamed protein product [Phytomonas sp. EM1]|eukprot:CCW63027.1 unnamed protein product [Phytomonas sp. isolate EM1]
MYLLGTSDDCLSSSRKACQPLGGWSVWATTGDSSWSWSDARHSFERKTAKGAVALMVPLTTASFGHLPTPGADSPASGITSALAITEAIKRQARNVEVSVFFLVGEYTGSIGSSRFIQDASSTLACEVFGVESCLKLAYKSNLNFTSVNFSNFDAIVALDQLSYSDSPLYFHVDQRIDQASNIALKSAKKLLCNMQIQKSKTNFLYSSPATTYIDFLEANNLLSGVNKTIVTFSRYDEFYNNPHVFTPSDTPSTNRQLNVESIIEASNVVLRMILSSDAEVKVDNDLLQKLWYCFSVNFSCDFLNVSLNLSSSTPSYATNKFEESYSDVTVMVGTALSKIGMRPAYTAAISPQLKIGEKWGPPWERSERVDYFNSSRYTLFVSSLFNKGNGARTVMLTTASVGTFTLFTGTFLCGLLLFAAFHL